MSGIYPCNVCKRQNILSDYYRESVSSRNSQLISHSAVNGRVVRPGQIYRHFKGNIVKVLQVAQNSELPGQYFVVYECGDSKTIWCRPSVFKAVTTSCSWPYLIRAVCSHKIKLRDCAVLPIGKCFFR